MSRVAVFTVNEVVEEFDGVSDFYSNTDGELGVYGDEDGLIGQFARGAWLYVRTVPERP